MDFKSGDKVSFLNEKRNGIITRVLGNKMFMVAIEEGFEIPVVGSELVHAIYTPEMEQVLMPDSPDEPDISDEFPERLELSRPKSSAQKQGLYLAFIPESEHTVAGERTYVYLVNHSIYDVLFTYALPLEQQFVCKDFDRVDSETALLLDTIGNTEFDHWKSFSIQAIFFIKGSTLQIPPLQTEIKIRPLKFFKEEHYIPNDLLLKKTLTLPINTDKSTEPEEWPEEQWTHTKIEKHSGPKIVGHIRHLNTNSPFPEKHLIDKETAEIDLHIEELTDNYADKSNHELLRIQLDYFIQMLDNAITAKLRKIIFIHGVGNGVLKKEITEKIQNDYPYLKINDAAMSKYGMGASEVQIFNEK